MAVLALSGCSAGSSGSTGHAAAGTKFSDSYGGTGGMWTFPTACPTSSAMETLAGLPSLTATESDGTPSNDGCHYGNIATAQAVEVFEDAKDYAGKPPTDPGAKATLAPSLGKGAQVATAGALSSGCSVFVPTADSSTFKSIVVTLINHTGTAKGNCAAAVSVLKGFASQH